MVEKSFQNFGSNSFKKLVYYVALASKKQKMEKRQKVLEAAIKNFSYKKIPKTTIVSKTLPLQKMQKKEKMKIVHTIPGLNLGIINNLLSNPEIDLIECPGENQNIKVRINGEIKILDLKFSEKEINKIIMAISEYTKIPVVYNTIKVTLGDFLFNGISSEVTGSRFILIRINKQ